VNDLSLIIEQIAAIRVGDEERTRQLRQRYVSLTLEAMHAPAAAPLPGPAPTWEELSGRWGQSRFA
ncbi:MAG: TetR/AcrR family transcriptional regulator, partial [Acidimicrobiia bacterium]